MSLQQRLEQAEGRVKFAYQDSLGYWTIGIGRLVDKRKGGGLSDDEIDYLLANDIKKRTLECKQLFRDFDSFPQSIQEALIEMMFNIGFSNISSYHTFISQVNAKDWKGVQANIRSWNKWITQVGMKRVQYIIDAFGEE